MLNQDFKEFIQLLNFNQVKYLVIGIDFTTCYQAKIEVVIDNISVNFIDLENLRKNKKASGRLQDLADLENLQD